MNGASVEWREGRPVLAVFGAEAVAELTRVLAQVDHRARWQTGQGLRFADEIVRAARAVSAVLELVPHEEPTDDNTPARAKRWISTTDAADALGITPRAVRKRITSGALPARQVAGRWIVDMKGAA